MKHSAEFENFDTFTGKVLSVSREELKRREEQWRKEHPKPQRKRNRKTAGSGGEASAGG